MGIQFADNARFAVVKYHTPLQAVSERADIALCRKNGVTFG